MKVCLICGKAFEATTNQKFCCKECSIEARRRRNRQYEAEARKKRPPKQKKPVSPRPCKQCGKMFVPEHRNGIYCSDDCKRLAMNARQMRYYYERQEREKNPNPVRLTNPPKKSVADIVREARALGLSYGQYMLQVEGRR